MRSCLFSRGHAWIAVLVLFSSPGRVSWAGEWAGCSPESESLLQRAAGCMDHEDFGCAKMAVDRVRRHQPRCGMALYIQSFLTEHDGNQEKGEAQREQALELDPGLKDFWEKRGHYIENQLLTTQEFAHFILKFNGGGNRDNAWKAVQNLDAAYDFLVSRFGEAPANKVEVMVFTGSEFVDAWRAPFIGGFFDRKDGKVRVRIDDVPGGEDYFRVICRHEFTHAFLYQLYSKELPMWFVEGAAEFYGWFDSTDSFWKDNRLAKLQRETKGYPIPSLAQLSETIKKKSGRAIDVYLAYQFSQALMLYVAKDHGDSWIPRFVNRLREGLSFDEAFQDVVGITPDRAMEQLQKAWE